MVLLRPAVACPLGDVRLVRALDGYLQKIFVTLLEGLLHRREWRGTTTMSRSG